MPKLIHRTKSIKEEKAAERLKLKVEKQAALIDYLSCMTEVSFPEVTSAEEKAKVKAYYDDGLWTKQMVHDSANKWITEAEYKLITGEDY